MRSHPAFFLFVFAFVLIVSGPALAIDTDGDGLDDAVEDALGTNPGLADSDGDLIDDFVETNGGSPIDTDGDAVIDALDTDSDGDGYTDLVESTFDSDADGTADYRDTDADGDGVLDQDEFDVDLDSDGSDNRIDPDDDGDGYSTLVEGTVDTDLDGTADYLDFDSDGDTVLDRNEFAVDFDADGAANRIDPDDDGDGILTSIEGVDDVDGDGNLNYLDLDSDGDGFADAEEGTDDPDSDGVPNFLDFDSDDDGFTDSAERIAGSDPYDPASNPDTVSSPVIVDVQDVGNDQGRRLRLNWTRSSLDELGSVEPIVDYAVYRRIEAGAAAESGVPLFRAPVGDWDFVLSLPATTEDDYFALVESLCDSTDAGPCWSVYFVRALTAVPGVFYDSAPDSGMSVDNLAPSTPSGFAVAYGSENVLSWEPSPDEDFRYFKVYRGPVAGFTSETGTLVRTTTDAGWVDSVGDPTVGYLVSAVDFAGNESPAAAPAIATGVGGAPRVRAVLEQNVPNPFNPSTSIAFRIQATGTVNLRVHDAAGRLVRVLVDGETLTPGRHVVRWDGRDGAGSAVAGGVYWYSVEGPGLSQARRMVLVK